ncbi:MAG: MoxR-like ATPase [Clostridium sp.]|jgi:MoxR-like ATPase
MDTKKFEEFRTMIVDNVGKVIVGKEDTIEKVIVCFICSGHVLIEDVPGLGKTKLAKSLSRTMNCSFKRIQFTPDLLPSDLTGIYYYNQKKEDFEFRSGPLLS